MSSNPIFSRNVAFNGQNGLLEKPRRNPYQVDNSAPPVPQADAYTAAAGAQAATVQGMAPQYGANAAAYDAAYGYTRGDAITYEDVIAKAGLLFGAFVVTAVATWSLVPPAALSMAMGVGSVLTFALLITVMFTKKVNPVVALVYAAGQGVALGALSRLLEHFYPGIALQAISATMVVFVVTLLLFRSGKVRATPKFRKVLTIGMTSYLVFLIGNLAVTLISGTSMRTGGFGLVIGLIAVVLASMSLISDFDNITTAVESGAPRQYSWLAAFGLVVTLIWLYLELLRIIAILRD